MVKDSIFSMLATEKINDESDTIEICCGLNMYVMEVMENELEEIRSAVLKASAKNINDCNHLDRILNGLNFTIICTQDKLKSKSNILNGSRFNYSIILTRHEDIITNLCKLTNVLALIQSVYAPLIKFFDKEWYVDIYIN